MTVTSILLELATALLLSICTAYVINQTLYSPLRHVPGPAIAKLTNIYQLVVYYQGRQVRVIRDLHDRYGSAVRIGPRHVSLNDPSLISTVYSLKGDYIKASLLSYAPKVVPIG